MARIVKLNTDKINIKSIFKGRLSKQDRYYKFNRETQVLFPISIITSLAGNKSFYDNMVLGEYGWFRVYIKDSADETDAMVKFSDLENLTAFSENDDNNYLIKATYKGNEVTLYNPPKLSDKIAGMLKNANIILSEDEKCLRKCEPIMITLNDVNDSMGENDIAKKIISKLTLDHRQPISLHLYRRELEGIFDELIKLNDELWNTVGLFIEEYKKAVKNANRTDEFQTEEDYKPFESPRNYTYFASFIKSTNKGNSKVDTTNEGNRIIFQQGLKTLAFQTYLTITDSCIKVMDKLSKNTNDEHPLRKQFFDLQLMSLSENSGKGNISAVELYFLWKLAERNKQG